MAQTTLLYEPSNEQIIKQEGFLATIKPQKEVLTSAKIPGFINKIYVKENQVVKKGDILVSIDDTEVYSNIKALKSTISMQELDSKIAKKTYVKNLKLYKIGGLSKEKLDLSKVAYLKKVSLLKNSKENLIQLNNQLRYLSIASPIDGVVVKKLLDEGNIASKPILKIASSKELLFEYANSDIKLNDKVFYKGDEIGYISKIYKEAKNGLKEAKVTLTKPIKNPLYTNIDILVVIDQASGIALPNSAFVHKQDGDFVVIFDDDKYKLQKVTIILSDEEKSIIKEQIDTKVALGSEIKLLGLVFKGK